MPNAITSETEFGARWLAELQRLGVGLGNWNYATVTALQKADRQQFVELFQKASPRPSCELIQFAMSDEPEALARRLVEAGRADALLPILMFSF
jgi:hypothetical protein